MKLFEAYLELHDKQPVGAFSRPRKLYTLEEAQRFDEYGGRLTPEALLIDIDDSDQAETMLRMVKDLRLKCEVRETDRGMHFWFKQDGRYQKNLSRQKTAIGFTVDVKNGLGNSFAKLKSHGVERKVIYSLEEDGEFQAAPKWLNLMPESTVDISDLDKGARNSTLYSYQIQLIKAGLTKDECRECTRLINKYVLKNPLPEGELEVILRDEAYDNLLPDFFTEKGKFLHYEMAQFLAKKYSVKKIQGELYLYNEGWKLLSVSAKKLMIDMIPSLTNAQRNEVYNWIVDNYQDVPETPLSDARYILFNNGVLDIMTGTMQPQSPDFIILNKIPWDYRTDTRPNTVDVALDHISCGDASLRKLLEECAGYLFYRRNELRKCFLLLGPAQGGKSTFASALRNVLGEANYSALDISQLSERFKTAQITGKLANIRDDISDGYIVDPSVLKGLITGEELDGERKGEHPFKFKPYAKHVYTLNDMPRIKDKSGAVLSRLIIIPCRYVLNKADYDPQFIDKLTSKEAAERLIYLGVEALKGVLRRKAFTESASVQRELSEYDKTNRPVLGFIDEVVTDELLEREPVQGIWGLWVQYCDENGLEAGGRNRFTSEMKSALKSYTTRKKRVKGYPNPVAFFVREQFS